MNPKRFLFPSTLALRVRTSRPDSSGRKHPKNTRWLIGVLALAMAFYAIPLVAQHGGRGGGGGGGGGEQGDGDLYGDLYVIDRDVNGVPIPVLIEIEGVPTWVYQPMDASGDPIPFGEDGEVIDEELLVEVDFGRLSSMRAPEEVTDMSFDTLISAIQAADTVTRGLDGRLILQTGTDLMTIDSPIENLAAYKELMQHGHIQTDPMATFDEHGSPLETVYRPALREEDYPKFLGPVRCLLPNYGDVTFGTDGYPDPIWLQDEPLDNTDLRTAACLLAAGADKDAILNVDLVEYLNLIMDIPGAEDLVDPLRSSRTYVDFRSYPYLRTAEFNGAMEALVIDSLGGWQPCEVDALYWLADIDPLDSYDTPLSNVAGFVQTANDAVRIIQFIHNYGVPEVIWDKTMDDAPFIFE